MQYSSVLLALVASVSAQSAGPYPSNGTQYTTITTTAFTTYCPEATILTHGGNTYTVTEATTLTITDCPCTITQPIIQPTPSTVLYTSCPPESSNTPPPPAPPAPEPTTTYTNPLTVITQTSKGVAVTSTVGCPGAGCAPPASTPATCNGNCPKSGTASGTGSVPSPTSPSQFTGAASANKVGGVMLAAVGVVALAL